MFTLCTLLRKQSRFQFQKPSSVLYDSSCASFPGGDDLCKCFLFLELCRLNRASFRFGRRLGYRCFSSIATDIHFRCRLQVSIHGNKDGVTGAVFFGAKRTALRAAERSSEHPAFACAHRGPGRTCVFSSGFLLGESSCWACTTRTRYSTLQFLPLG